MLPLGNNWVWYWMESMWNYGNIFWLENESLLNFKMSLFFDAMLNFNGSITSVEEFLEFLFLWSRVVKRLTMLLSSSIYSKLTTVDIVGPFFNEEGLLLGLLKCLFNLNLDS